MKKRAAPLEASELPIRSVSLLDSPDPSDWLGQLPVVVHLARQGPLVFRNPVTFLVGENGTGKSTLLEAMAVAYGFNAEGGSRHFAFSTCATHSGLHERIRLGKGVRRPTDGFFLRAESFYNVASRIDELDREPASAPPIIRSYGGRSLHAQSHGESFLSLVIHRFGGNGLYLLDEPEAALSPSRLFTLLVRLDELVRAGSQFIIATHSPVLMAYPGAEILVLDREGIHPTPYEETDHVRLTRRFLNHPESMLRELLGPNEP